MKPIIIEPTLADLMSQEVAQVFHVAADAAKRSNLTRARRHLRYLERKRKRQNGGAMLRTEQRIAKARARVNWCEAAIERSRR